MIERNLSKAIKPIVEKIPVIVITGPRQSGKTTLSKMLFQDYKYVNLEFPDQLELALEDPRGLLKNFEKGIILDEIQRAPKLLSYIQALVDEKGVNGKIILTGSQNMNMMQSVSQTLAGRSVLFNLLPFSISELLNSNKLYDNFEQQIFTGFYPRLYDNEISPEILLPSYIQTYIERDVRQIINIRDLHKFQLLVRLLAGRIGQMVNFMSLSNEIGVDAKTIKAWISILEMSFIIFLVYPHHQNFGKRLVKTPKLYFYDTGIICSILGIQNSTQLETHYLKGNLFENMILADVYKSIYNRGNNQQLFFWRDNTGNEIDCILEIGNEKKLIEIKSSDTYTNTYTKNLRYINKLLQDEVFSNYIVLGNADSRKINDIQILNWKTSSTILD